MKIELRSINATGLAEIREFLAQNHKHGPDLDDTMIRAWARDAEFQMGEGNPPTIEIRAWDSLAGCTQEFRISPAGIDTEIVDDGGDDE